MSVLKASDDRKARRLSVWWVVAAWVAAVFLFWLRYGAWIGLRLEGNDGSLIPVAPLVLPTLVLIVAFVLTTIWVRGWGRDRAEPTPGLSRRRFLLGTAVNLGGVAASAVAAFGRNYRWVTVTSRSLRAETPRKDPNPRSEWGGSRVAEYRRLGRTEARVSDISLGSARLHPERGGEELARAAIDRGINYFDTSPDYSEAGSETALGRAMKGRRDQMFVATKFCTPQGHLPAGSSVNQYMHVVEESLKRLQTDHVDLVHIHAVNSLERLLDPNVHEAFGRLKEQGKARFLGFSSHAPNLEQVAEAALEDGRFDVMMLAYHHGAWPSLPSIIDRAASQDMGVVAMKTLKGAKHRGLLESRAESDSYTQAAFKWVLSNPSVSCLVISFFESQHLDEYLFASGKRPTAEDRALLQKYDQLIAGRHCFQHCGACLAACPQNLSIDDVLRCRMYFEDYRDEKQAMRLYARLDRQADVCMDCSGPCLGSCPYGVPIPTQTRGAHRMLTIVGLG